MGAYMAPHFNASKSPSASINEATRWSSAHRPGAVRGSLRVWL